MLHILTIILPVFGLIGLGYAARFAGYVTDRTGEGLSEFVFAIAIPCLIFKTLTGAVLPETQKMVTMTPYQADVSGRAKLEAPKAEAAKPTASAPEAEAEEAPKKRESKKAAEVTPTAKKSLASVAAAWSTDEE